MSTMIKRSQRRTPATLVAVVLLGIGVLAAWVGIQAAITGQIPGWIAAVPQTLSTLTWASAVVLALGAVVAVLGLILLISAFKPGRPSAVRIQPPETETPIDRSEVVLTRAGIARLSGAQASQVDGVDAVSVTATGRRVRIFVRSAATDGDAMAAAVTDQVSSRLQELKFVTTPTVRTTVRASS